MILLDANVLLEILITRRPHQKEVQAWLESSQEEYCISMLSVHLVLYFGLLDKLNITQLRSFLSDYPKIGLLPEDYVAAMKIMRDKDHEDALQLATAERVQCTHIVTLDKHFAATYKDRIGFINPLTEPLAN